MGNSEVRAAAARRLLDDPLLAEVLDAVEAAAIQAWRTTSDQALQNMAWHSLKASERIRTTLEGIRDDGLIAANRAVRPSSVR